MSNSPFLSVCLIATTREDTIFYAMKSLCEQSFDDFEVIVTIRKYSDRTIEEIDRFKSTKLFKVNSDKFKIYEIDKEYDDINEWNDPLQFAKGLYVGILEGDDKFGSSHLQDVYNKITCYPNIGLYATGNSYGSCHKLGFIKNNEYYKYLLTFVSISPPSQTFFKRVDSNGMNYYYNTKDFVYAPEIELYLRIIKDGYNAYHSSNNAVIRAASGCQSRHGYKKFQDTIYLVGLNRDKYGLRELIDLNLRIKKRLFKQFLKVVWKQKKIDWKILRGLLSAL